MILIHKIDKKIKLRLIYFRVLLALFENNIKIYFYCNFLINASYKI